MKKKDVKKKYGLSDENFSFYVSSGHIKKLDNEEFDVMEGFGDQILEKSTVFKYSYDDDFYKDIKEFSDFVKYTGKVKRYTPEEIKEFEKKRKKEDD